MTHVNRKWTFYIPEQWLCPDFQSNRVYKGERLRGKSPHFRLTDMRLSKIKGVFERRTSTGSEVFSFFICHDTTKLFLPILYSYRDDLTENLDKTTSDCSRQSLSTTVLFRTPFTRTIMFNLLMK